MSAETSSKISPDLIDTNIKSLRNFVDFYKSDLRIVVKSLTSNKHPKLVARLNSLKKYVHSIELHNKHYWTDANPPDSTITKQVSMRESGQVLDKKSSSKKICPFPYYTLAVHSDGIVTPCCVDWSRKSMIGDLSMETLSEIWNGERIFTLRSDFECQTINPNEACSGCEYFQNNTSDNLDALLRNT
jgi:radical SAM protein with 4Fe4S-binding SPASM domain